MALLFRRKPALQCRRILHPVFSLSDPNPVKLYIENKGNLHLNVADCRRVAGTVSAPRFRDKIVAGAYKPRMLRNIELRPLSRGVYAFGNINVFAATRIGLAERRIVFAQPEDVAVYPSIIQMKRYELRAMRHIAHETGIKKMRRIGHSYEFEQIKNYVQGDDYRSINWKASSRRAPP
jgi:uncharacterized protein (DUF58 family)